MVGVKTYVYQLGSGLIEFLAIGTAVKKISTITTESPQLPPQAIVVDRDTFYDSSLAGRIDVNLNAGSKTPFTKLFFPILLLVLLLIIQYFSPH